MDQKNTLNQKDTVMKHLEITEYPHYFRLKNSGLYVARLIVNYTYGGVQFTKDSGPIVASQWGKIDIPMGVTNAVVTGYVDWGPFGLATIFQKEYPGPETHCFEVSGIAFYPTWQEVKC